MSEAGPHARWWRPGDRVPCAGGGVPRDGGVIQSMADRWPGHRGLHDRRWRAAAPTTDLVSVLSPATVHPRGLHPRWIRLVRAPPPMVHTWIKQRQCGSVERSWHVDGLSGAHRRACCFYFLFINRDGHMPASINHDLRRRGSEDSENHFWSSARSVIVVL